MGMHTFDVVLLLTATTFMTRCGLPAGAQTPGT